MGESSFDTLLGNNCYNPNPRVVRVLDKVVLVCVWDAEEGL